MSSAARTTNVQSSRFEQLVGVTVVALSLGAWGCGGDGTSGGKTDAAGDAAPTNDGHAGTGGSTATDAADAPMATAGMDGAAADLVDASVGDDADALATGDGGADAPADSTPVNDAAPIDSIDAAIADLVDARDANVGGDSAPADANADAAAEGPAICATPDAGCDGGACCGDKCVAIATDPGNCGGCGMACSMSHVAASCSASTCGGACDVGYTDCDNDKRTNGCEINTAGDPAHCGACNTPCSTSHVTATCSGGTCGGACDVGYTDCDNDKRTNGCEINTAGDPAHCGACNTACSTSHVTATCSGGTCGGACDVGFNDCDNDKRTNGCETNTAAGDPNNCGGCNMACSTSHVTATCSGGACGGACDVGFNDCDNDKRTNGCETNGPCH